MEAWKNGASINSLRSSSLPIFHACVPSLASQRLQQSPVGVLKLHHHRHLPNGVGGATQARVVTTNGGFDAVEHAFLEFARFDVLLSDRLHGPIHREVIMTG